MAYLGVQPLKGQNRTIDNISASFNGSNVTFNLTSGGFSLTPATAYQLFISVGGVLQSPGVDFTVSGNQITFTTAPAAGLSFWGLYQGDAIDSVSVSDGSITTAKLATGLTVTLGAGSASTPSLTFAGDTNNGIYTPGADQLSITTGGTERFRIDSNGQLEAVSLGSASTPTFTYVGDPNTGTFSPGADTWGVTTGGTERVRIDSSGRVGIGTTNPGGYSGQLVINISPSGDHLVFADDTTSSGAAAARLGCSGNNLVFKTNSGASAAAERARIDSSGRLLVGVSNAVAGPQNYQTLIARLATSTDETLGLQYPGVATWGISVQSNADLSIKRDGTERARIDSSGRLLVGTSSSASAGDAQFARLQVQANTSGSTGSALIALQRGEAATSITSGETLGAVLFTDSAGYSFAEITAQADASAGSGDYPGRLVFSTCPDSGSSPVERMRIKQNGFTKISSSGSYFSESGTYHEIRSTTDSSEALLVSHGGTSGQQYGITVVTANDQNDTTRWFYKGASPGVERFTVRSNGGIANYQANNVNLSDRNTKKDISPAAGTWECVKEWEIVNYRYKDQPDDADLSMGVIAQQVAESCPEVITVFQDAKEATEDQPAQEERLGIKEQQMYWMAIKALQEAQVRIEALEAEVAALKAQ